MRPAPRPGAGCRIAAWSLLVSWAAWSCAWTCPAQAASAEEPVETAQPQAPADPEAGVEGSFTDLTEEPSLEASSVPEDQRIQASSLGLDERVSLDLRNIEVSDALRFLAQKGGLNLAISKNVSGRVQLLLNNVPIRDIFDIILITNALAYEKHGEVYHVMTEEEFKGRFGRKFSDARKVKVFRLRYAIPEQAFSVFEILKSEIGRLLVDPESGTVLVMDAEENIRRMELALEGLEKRRSVKVYPLKYAKAVEVEARLKVQLDNKKVGLVAADERTNSVIVETLPERMADIDLLVESLDEKTREVLIDAKVVKVTLSDDFAQQIKWEGIMRSALADGDFFVANHPFAALARTSRSFVDDFVNIAPTTTPLAGEKNELSENLFLGHVKNNDAVEALIKFLRTIGDTKVLSNPKLAVVNNQEAKIHVGEKQAYVTTTTTTGQTTTTTAESVTFIDVGIQLSVTPTINEDGYVTMKIKPEISSVVDFLTTPSGNRIPIVDSSLAETTVMVKDGVSIVIGGLRREEKIESRKKVPILGDLPIIGAPFNSYTTENNQTELMIVLTPHVVYGDKLVTGATQPGQTPYLPYADYGAAPLPRAAAQEPAPSRPPVGVST